MFPFSFRAIDETRYIVFDKRNVFMKLFIFILVNNSAEKKDKTRSQGRKSFRVFFNSLSCSDILLLNLILLSKL